MNISAFGLQIFKFEKCTLKYENDMTDDIIRSAQIKFPEVNMSKHDGQVQNTIFIYLKEVTTSLEYSKVWSVSSNLFSPFLLF